MGAEAGHGLREIGGALVLHWGATGRRYFSRAIGLGVTVPASEETIDAILGLWEELGIDMSLLQSLPHCQPDEYEHWLRARGLAVFDAQDRIVRGGEPLSATPAQPGGRELALERVAGEVVDEWAEFLQRVYRLDTGSWLPSADRTTRLASVRRTRGRRDRGGALHAPRRRRPGLARHGRTGAGRDDRRPRARRGAVRNPSSSTASRTARAAFSRT